MGRAEELVGWSSGRGTESSGLAKCALTAFGRLASWLACLCYRCLQSLGSPLFPSIQEKSPGMFITRQDADALITPCKTAQQTNAAASSCRAAPRH